MKRPIIAILALSAVALAAAACATSEPLVRDARSVLEDARSVHADYLAPYEFAMAEYFLDEAETRNSAADHARAVEYAKESKDWADKARTLAKTRVRNKIRDQKAGGDGR